MTCCKLGLQYVFQANDSGCGVPLPLQPSLHPAPDHPMKPPLLRLLAFALPFLAFDLHALPPNVEHVETFRGVAQYKLKSNDMTILLVPNHASPVVTFMVVYHVGSRNEAPGNTGSAHLLEHMIFNKSTENFGRAKGHKTFQEVLFEVGADAGSSNMTTWNDRMNGYSTVPTDK